MIYLLICIGSVHSTLGCEERWLTHLVDPSRLTPSQFLQVRVPVQERGTSFSSGASASVDHTLYTVVQTYVNVYVYVIVIDVIILGMYK